MPYLGIFGIEFENNIVIFEVNALEICLIAKFSERINV